MKLTLQHISKSFTTNLVLDDFSMELESGEIVVLQGPSGVGKTTLLRCINQLESIDHGIIMIDGKVIAQATQSKQNNRQLSFKKNKQSNIIQQSIGYVFQQYQLFPHLNVMDNLIAAPLHHGLMNYSEALAKATNLLENLAIQHKHNAYPFQLSGGQKQRVAIARACMLNPKFLCFDEPTAALDSISIEGVISLIKDLARTGMGVLIVSHDSNFASAVATRTIILTA